MIRREDLEIANNQENLGNVDDFGHNESLPPQSMVNTALERVRLMDPHLSGSPMSKVRGTGQSHLKILVCMAR